MKRGFLLRAEKKDSATKRRGAQQHTEPLALSTPAEPRPVPQNLKGFDVDKQGHLFAKLAYGNLSEEEKALPSDYHTKKPEFVGKEFDPRITEFSDDMTVVTAIPQPVPNDETQSQWIVNGSTKGKVLNAPGYPARVPTPRRPDLYQVRSTPDMGVGLFAKRNIKRGDLILAERPLLVAPHAMKLSSSVVLDHYTEHQIRQIMMREFETVLESTVARLSNEQQADFKALQNSHTGDGSGPLLGVMRTNRYGINLYDGSDKDAKYGAVCNIGSRINHSCKPNVRCSFKLNSFSMQFYALQDVKPGEQLFYAYCSTNGTLAQRQAEIAPYGFVCKCPACVNATPETDKLRSTYETQIALFTRMVGGSSKINEAALEDAVRLEKDMVKEGLDIDYHFVELLEAICLGYAKLGKMEEYEKYDVLVVAYRRASKDVE